MSDFPERPPKGNVDSLNKEIEQAFIIRQMAKAIVDQARPWYYSGAGVLAGGAWLFLAFLLSGIFFGYVKGGLWTGGIVVFVLAVAVISTAVASYKGKKDDG